MSRVRVTARQLGDRHFQVNLSDRVCLITQSLLRAGKGGRKARVKAAYFGFPTHDEAVSFASEIRRRFPACRMQVRQSKRLATVWEVKISHRCAEQLAWQILFQGVSTSKRLSQHIADCQRRQQLQQQAAQKAAMIASAAFQGRGSGRITVQCDDRMVGID